MEGPEQIVLFVDEDDKINNFKCLLELTETLIIITRKDQAVRKIKELGFLNVLKESSDILLFQEKCERISKIIVYSDKLETTSHFLECAQRYFKAPIILITENKKYSVLTYKLLGANLVIYTNSIHILPFLK
ncbi:hypothetical protein [Gottfriedia acidiceleris]|uniref:hypothetical protein n=1 Tax=Gottfriedia acidiceleris TaxID=371036 RepID=UPI000B43A791|nr:hypothetical protein [Gottfriedia acidiceleris]